MSVAGLADLSITNNNNNNLVEIKTCVIVTRQPAHPALISWHDMVRLNIIHDLFPVTALHTTSSIDHLRSSVIKANPNVFKDSITSTPMCGGEVHIHLLPNAVPFQISVARQIPLRFTAPAEAAINNLLENGIIARCEEPTDWCSPGFFVPKSDGKSVRLVTDYTKLNSFVQRLVHAFPSVNDIVQAIPSSASIFAKFDTVNGYFQIALDEESSKLTTFILPSGRYRYKRIPQGLNASSDEWCRRSDVVIEGLPWARKLVDYIIVWASNLEELSLRINEITSRCEKLNIILSKKKFVIGDEITFAGYSISKDGVKPDSTQVKAIKEFPVPIDTTGHKY